ncbi:MAG: MASE3 domain-containing protein, partial [Candidatus Omnitrophica bacterium]|nr:MASE3 domain-containing protein [Candidatus Omnitrophota bacterium]
MEAPCIAIGGMIFFLTWFSYDNIPGSYRLLGFSYLITSFLYVVHTGTYPSYSAENNTAQALLMAGRFIEALAFFTFAFRINLRLKKTAALLLSVLIGGAITYIIIHFHS